MGDIHKTVRRALWHPGVGWLLIDTCGCALDKELWRLQCLAHEENPHFPWTAADTAWLWGRLYGDELATGHAMERAQP